MQLYTGRYTDRELGPNCTFLVEIFSSISEYALRL